MSRGLTMRRTCVPVEENGAVTLKSLGGIDIMEAKTRDLPYPSGHVARRGWRDVNDVNPPDEPIVQRALPDPDGDDDDRPRD